MTKRDIKGVSAKKLIKRFDFKILYKGNLNKKILFPGLHRTGIELSSKYKLFDKIDSAVLWSSNESKFLNQLSKTNQNKAIESVLKLNPPIILLGSGFKHVHQLLSIAKNYNTTIVDIALSSSQAIIIIATWIVEHLTTYQTIHGTLVNVYGLGVLIQGESGVGKSEIALELVRKGHYFVADDAVDVANIGYKLLGKANAVANKFIEVRGLGILNIPKMFGVEKVQEVSNVDMVIELILDIDKKISFERLGSKTKTKVIDGVKIPYYKLPITPGRKMADLIESAAIDLKLKQQGYNSAEDYMRNYNTVSKQKDE